MKRCDKVLEQNVFLRERESANLVLVKYQSYLGVAAIKRLPAEFGSSHTKVITLTVHIGQKQSN